MPHVLIQAYAKGNALCGIACNALCAHAGIFGPCSK